MSDLSGYAAGRCRPTQRQHIMMIIIPIRTESIIRRTPLVNYLLIAANLLSFLVFNAVPIGAFAEFKTRYLVFHAAEPMLTQFFNILSERGGLSASSAAHLLASGINSSGETTLSTIPSCKTSSGPVTFPK